jgi:signal transduction histidine kinase
LSDTRGARAGDRPPKERAPGQRASVAVIDFGASDLDAELVRRLTRLTGLRLLVWTLLLGIVALVYLRGQTGGFSSFVAFATVSSSYALSAIYAFMLRRGRHLRLIAYAQLISDQLAWTALVYVTGGVTSGGVSLYGLTCLTGAILLGYRGGIVALVGALGSYVALAAALIGHFLPGPSDQPLEPYQLEWSEAAYPMLANSIGLALVTAMASYLAERLRVTGGDLALAKRRAQEAEQLAVLGRLAAGLAHEIRNPLGSIAGSVELLKTSPALGADDKRLCDIVQREADRLNDLVGDMLELSRARPPQPETVDVAELAHEVVTLASRSGRGGDVEVVYRGLDRAQVSVDPSQFRQVLWNLVRNAVQASSSGGTVTVRVDESTDDKLAIEVSDHGAGIPSDQLDRLFDAFYTTRTHGTGIGLAVVKRIVQDHGFVLEVESPPGDGATFRVLVPKSSRRSAEAAGSGDSTHPKTARPGAAS